MSITVGGTTATAGQITQIKTDLGLGNVSNTADADKPVGTLQAAAITSAVAGKADASAVTAALATKADDRPPLVVASGTTLVRATHYNRVIVFNGGTLAIDSTGAINTDSIGFFNIGSSAGTVTVGGSTVLTLPAAKAGDVNYTGSAWVDPTVAGVGGSYTDAQALAAAVLAGALGTSTTQAPTHDAVADALALKASTEAALLIVTGTAAPSNADGRPDGTIYIQTA